MLGAAHTTVKSGSVFNDAYSFRGVITKVMLEILVCYRNAGRMPVALIEAVVPRLHGNTGATAFLLRGENLAHGGSPWTCQTRLLNE